MLNLTPTVETAYSSKLAYAYNTCTCYLSFEMFRKIYQAMKRCKEIESLGLSGLAAWMYPDERQEHRDLQLFLRQREIFFGDGMREIYAVLEPLC